MEAERPVEPRLAKRASPMISEIILENFMSYEYGRIPIKKGINVITGPNGAGKSTILLAISVALGQAYTERSRKLSDLIRRGKDIARVSLMFDNREKNGKRPIPFSKSDTFLLSRYIKADGTYWYEADYREVSRSEVARLFRRFGISPDNLLIIMHQGMVEEFSITSAQDKLKMVEEAVGFHEFREGIIESQQKLTGLVTEEKDLSKVLESAGQTLTYWKEMYDRFLKRRELLQKKDLLIKELFWAQVITLEKTLSSLRERREHRKKVLHDVEEQIQKTQKDAKNTSENIDAAQVEQRKLYFTLIRLEKERKDADTRIELSSSSKEELESITKFLNEALASTDQNKVITSKREELEFKIDSLSSKSEALSARIKEYDNEIKSIQSDLAETERAIRQAIDKLVSLKVKEALLDVRKKNIEREIIDVERSIHENEEQMNTLLTQSNKPEPRIETQRSFAEVSEEIKINEAENKSLGEIPEDVETIYKKFSSSYAEISDKLAVLAQNREKTLRELDERKKVWKEKLQNLIAQINPNYQNILAKINATGLVRIVEGDDIEKGGLELHVGFRGAPMAVLDAYTQSGGERGVSVMAFLLSLQQGVISPFRAVDEFDVHLDPKNREALLKMIFSHIRERPESQYIVITPSQLTVMEKDVHLVFVQNMYGKSAIKEVRK